MLIKYWDSTRISLDVVCKPWRWSACKGTFLPLLTFYSFHSPLKLPTIWAQHNDKQMPRRPCFDWIKNANYPLHFPSYLHFFLFFPPLFNTRVITCGHWSLAPTYWSKGGVDDRTHRSRALWTQAGSVLSNTHDTHLVRCVCAFVCVYVCPLACPTFKSSQDTEWGLRGEGCRQTDLFSSHFPVPYCTVPGVGPCMCVGCVWWTLMRQWKLAGHGASKASELEHRQRDGGFVERNKNIGHSES